MLAQGRLKMPQSDVHGRETIVELQGRLAIRESSIDQRRMMVHQELQAIGLPESRVAQGKARALFNGRIQRGNG